MRGIIVLVNLPKGRAAVKTENDEYSYFEIVDSHEPEFGDIIEGKLETLGSEDLYNATQNNTFNVFIEDIHTTKAESAIFVLGNR